MIRQRILGLGGGVLALALLAQPSFATTKAPTPVQAWAIAQNAANEAAPAAAADDEPDPASIEAEQRAIERHHQLTIHQVLGLSTLVALGGTFAMGKLYQMGTVPQGAHVAFAGLASGLYLTTAGLALLAPSPGLTPNLPTGWDSVTVHRALAWGHAAGMVSTVGLGISSVMGGPANPALHGWLGLGTTVLMTLSAGGILLAP